MCKEAQKLAGEFSGLVSPPTVWAKINEVVGDPFSSADDIADVILRDPSLTGAVLRVVNSPLYAFTGKIDTVSRAVMVIGLRDLFSIATAISAARTFSGITSEFVTPESFWKHCVSVGLIARILAKKRSVLHIERMFVSGILHDIGNLAIYSARPEMVEHVLNKIKDEDFNDITEIERETFGFDHAEVGMELLRSWSLPPSILYAVRYHHNPDHGDGSYKLDADIIFAANHIARGCDKTNLAGITSGGGEWRDSLERLGICPAESEEILEQALRDLTETMSIIMPEHKGYQA